MASKECQGTERHGALGRSEIRDLTSRECQKTARKGALRVLENRES